MSIQESLIYYLICFRGSLDCVCLIDEEKFVTGSDTKYVSLFIQVLFVHKAC